MLENERRVLKGNAESLAGLLTENVPYLISHYLKGGVLSEVEREDIISQSSAQEIRVKLVETLGKKEDIGLESIIEGLNATGNQSVSEEIERLLSENSEEKADLTEVSQYATNLVDEVIETAEKRTSHLFEDQPEDEEEVVAQSFQNGHGNDSEEEEELQVKEPSLVEASVEVHISEPEVVEDEISSEDAVDKTVSFQQTVATVIEDHPKKQEEEYNGGGGDNESEVEDNDIDVDKEFAMPAEQETNNNREEVKKAPVLTRMESNEVVIEGEDNDDHQVGPDGELGSAMGRKALVKQQVKMFETTAPEGGKVKYSFRGGKVEPEKVDEQGSNVKNLKNFFQKLSTSEKQAAAPASGPVKPVGKLKVTFPAS